MQSFALPALSLGYASTVVLLWQDPVWQRRLMPFSYVGRMALTNYLLQSLICTTIFYSYGLGLYGRMGPLANLFLGLGDLQRADALQPVVAEHAPLRPDGVALAPHDVRAGHVLPQP